MRVRTVPSASCRVNVGRACIGRDAAGMTWDCYVGQDAVDQEIITQDFLGEPAGPGVG